MNTWYNRFIGRGASVGTTESPIHLFTSNDSWNGLLERKRGFVVVRQRQFLKNNCSSSKSTEAECHDDRLLSLSVLHFTSRWQQFSFLPLVDFREQNRISFIDLNLIIYASNIFFFLQSVNFLVNSFSSESGLLPSRFSGTRNLGCLAA